MYTKKQLIEAQYKYNLEYDNNPGSYNDNPDWTDKKTAIDQIEYLISLID